MRPIQLTIVESDWFKVADRDGGQNSLPSIREGSSVTIDGPIEVRMEEREEYEILETGALLTRQEVIHLDTTMS